MKKNKLKWNILWQKCKIETAIASGEIFIYVRMSSLISLKYIWILTFYLNYHYFSKPKLQINNLLSLSYIVFFYTFIGTVNNFKYTFGNKLEK